MLTFSVAPAQAVSWKPLNTAVTGTSINTRLEYGPQTIICNSEFKGTTAMAASATIPLSSWTFSECENPGEGYRADAWVTVGKTSLAVTATQATGGGNGVAQFEIPNEASVTFRLRNFFFITICTYTATGPQSLSGATFTDSANSLSFVTATKSANWVRSGSEATCGEEEEAAKFLGYWGVSPTNLAIE